MLQLRRPGRNDDEAAKPWRGYDSITCIVILRCLTTRRRSLFQRQMRPVVVIVTDVFVHQAFQVPLIQDNHVVEQIPAAVANPTLGNAVLPWTSETRPLGLDAETLHCLDYFSIEVCATIKDQELWSRIVWERLAQLLNDPGTGRMSGHIAMEDTPPVMRDDEEAVEHSEGERWHGEEIHCSDSFTMTAQKDRPSLCRLGAPWRSPHPASTVRSETSKPSIFNSP